MNIDDIELMNLPITESKIYPMYGLYLATRQFKNEIKKFDSDFDTSGLEVVANDLLAQINERNQKLNIIRGENEF